MKIMKIITKPWPYDCMPDVMRAIKCVIERNHAGISSANKDCRIWDQRVYDSAITIDKR